MVAPLKSAMILSHDVMQKSSPSKPVSFPNSIETKRLSMMRSAARDWRDCALCPWEYRVSTGFFISIPRSDSAADQAAAFVVSARSPRTRTFNVADRPSTSLSAAGS